MDGGHQALDDAEALEDHLGDGGEAIGGAGGVGDDSVLAGVVALLVDAHDDGDVLALGGGGDDHLLRAAVDVGFGLLAASVKTPVDSMTISAPRSRQGSLAGSRSARTADLVTVHDDGVFGGRDVAVERAVVAVVGEQVGEGVVYR